MQNVRTLPLRRAFDARPKFHLCACAVSYVGFRWPCDRGKDARLSCERRRFLYINLEVPLFWPRLYSQVKQRSWKQVSLRTSNDAFASTVSLTCISRMLIARLKSAHQVTETRLLFASIFNVSIVFSNGIFPRINEDKFKDSIIREITMSQK